MADLIRRVALAAINRNAHMHVRTLFSSSGIGIDNFKYTRDQHATRYAPSIDVFKKRFLESVGQSDSQVFAEDLRNMIMTASSDQEIDAVIQALKKYNSNQVKFTDYHFGSPVMRLLYIQNKTDQALQLFMDENLKNIFNDSASALVLMNKLIEEQRYDDALKAFEYGTQRGFSTVSGRKYPGDVVMLAIECLYRQNTKESLNKAKELVSKVRQSDADISPRAATMTALLAIQQGDPSFAMEILGAVRGQNLTTVQNLRAICYAEMGRVEEALNVVHLLADQKAGANDRRKVFPLVMRHIRTAVEKNQDQALLARFEDLSKFIMKNNRLSTIDLAEFIGQPINRRNPARQGGMLNNVRKSFQRFTNVFRNQDSSENPRRRQNSNENYQRLNDNDRASFRNRSQSFSRRPNENSSFQRRNDTERSNRQ